MSDEFNSLFSLGDQLCDTCDRMIELMRQNDALALMYAGVFQNFNQTFNAEKSKRAYFEIGPNTALFFSL